MLFAGLDDARNTAHLAWRMMRDGSVMKITRSLERAPLKTKPLFGNGNVPGDGCPGNKRDNKTTFKNPSKTTESGGGGHLENRPNSKPVSNTDVVETRPKPSDNMVPNTEPSQTRHMTRKQEVWRRTCLSRAVRMTTSYWRRTGMSRLVTRLLLLMCTQRT
uniref:uncharacterized protein LOC124029643 isoform X2 n=1 Tax=Oncorhynchus gorbuscha TaxID=8017 RepID=UPI001EAF13C9|nr:uncharacterized protein LOC124029643 isoform X2 [Oncorhynchus gorbuscha]